MKVVWTRAVATDKSGQLQDNVEVESTGACNHLLGRGKVGEGMCRKTPDFRLTDGGFVHRDTGNSKGTLGVRMRSPSCQ